MYKDTVPVGTLSHIDHEYQRNGVISTKFDVYAFGSVILRLLTAKRVCKVGISPTYKLMFRPDLYSMWDLGFAQYTYVCKARTVFMFIMEAVIALQDGFVITEL
jgi:hypothetical protein